MSYLGEGEQELIHQAAEQAGQKLRPKQAMELRKQARKIDREAADAVFRERDKPEGEKRMVKLLIDAAVYKEYLADVEEADVSGIMEKALRMYFGKAV